jgi:hypothetical protein
MPWKASSVMEERLRFVGRLLDGESMSDVCREFGISRKTGYKIYSRYEHGLVALTDRSTCLRQRGARVGHTFKADFGRITDMSVGGVNEDLAAPGYTLEGLLSVAPGAQDYQVALDSFLLGGRASQWSEFTDNTF